MATIIGVILGVAALVLWGGALMWLGVKATDALLNEDRALAVGWAAAAIVVFSVPIGLALQSDPNADRLCLAAHEEWQTRHTAPVMTGKVFVPGHSYRTKVWVCDQWERRPE